jgi:hypothetical protein
MSRVILIIAGGLFSVFGLTADQYAFSIDRKVTELQKEVRLSLYWSDIFSRLQGEILFADALHSLSNSWIEEAKPYNAATKMIDEWSRDLEEDQDYFDMHAIISDFSEEGEIDKEKLDQLYSELTKSETSEETYQRSYEYSRELSQALNIAQVFIYNVHEAEVEQLSKLNLIRQISISLAILMSLLTFITLALYIRFAAKATLETQVSIPDNSR